MQLQRDDPLRKRELWLVVHKIQNQSPVQEVLDSVSFHNDYGFIPVIQAEQLLELSTIDQLLGHLLPVGFPSRLFAHQTEPASLSSLVIDKSGDVWKFEFIADLVLIPSHDPIILHTAIGDVLRSILDSRVVRGGGTELNKEFEVLDVATFPDQKGIPLRWVARGGFPANHSVSNRPHRRIAIPTLQIVSVE